MAKKRKASTAHNDKKKMFKKKKDLFGQFSQSDTMDLEGIASLAEALGLDALTDITVLVGLWRMGATKAGTLRRAQFDSYCETHEISALENLQQPNWDVGFLEGPEFRKFYKFCFEFNLSGTHKTLENEVVQDLMSLVVGDRLVRTPDFVQFLQLHQTAYPKITLDQWMSYYDFCLEVQDISDYDEEASAWPVLIDEFVEYLQKK